MTLLFLKIILRKSIFCHFKVSYMLWYKQDLSAQQYLAAVVCNKFLSNTKKVLKIQKKKSGGGKNQTDQTVFCVKLRYFKSFLCLFHKHRCSPIYFYLENSLCNCTVWGLTDFFNRTDALLFIVEIHRCLLREYFFKL